jgi:two-component system cell cycle response regulator
MTGNILIVDDLEPNVRLLEAKLLSEYYTIFFANSGIKALEMLSLHKIDVVLLDVMMPGMDGFETCRRVKEDPNTTHIPVIMVTALSEIEDRIKGLEAGADEFLTKPINDIALFARVKSLSRIKTIIDELKLRNQTNLSLGASATEIKDNFLDSKIVLINDDVVQARNFKKTLNKISPQTEIITDLEEINKIDSYLPDLIIISCQLEDADPLRISVMLRSKEPLRHAMLMLFAEEENVQTVVKGMDLGVNDYFTYPVEENEFAAC